ncbi:RNA polymerase sigma factor [Paenibacillus tundrae]
MAFVKSVDCRINRSHDHVNQPHNPYTPPHMNTGDSFQVDDLHAVFFDAQRSLYAYCLSITGSREDAEDLVQETFAKVLSSFSVHKSGAERDINWEAYLIRIARNAWMDVLRKRQRLHCKMDGLKPLIEEMAEEEPLEELDTAVEILIKELPSWQRVIYMLRELLGYTAAEAAEMLDTTEGAVKSALRRARMTIAEIRDQLNDPDADEAREVSEERIHIEELRGYLLALRRGDTARLIDLCLNQTDDPMAVASTILQQALPSSTMQPMMNSYAISGSHGGGYTVSMVA